MVTSPSDCIPDVNEVNKAKGGGLSRGPELESVSEDKSRENQLERARIKKKFGS
jgi:hypothetical protein